MTGEATDIERDRVTHTGPKENLRRTPFFGTIAQVNRHACTHPVTLIGSKAIAVTYAVSHSYFTLTCYIDHDLATQMDRGSRQTQRIIIVLRLLTLMDLGQTRNRCCATNTHILAHLSFSYFTYIQTLPS